MTVKEDTLYELCGMVDFITQYGTSSSTYDISLTSLYNYLKNPYKNIKNIRLASKYLSHKHGIVKDVLKAFKSLPTLNYHLAWSSFDNPKQIKKYEQKIYDFLDNINVKKFVRDGLFESGEVGTIVVCLRNQKYVQFLELDDLRINLQVNGKWVVEYDLSSIKRNLPSQANTYDILAVIESLPDEVDMTAYKNYINKGEDFRFIEIGNCDVIGIDNNRNTPFGLPMTMGAWTALLQKEIISRVERSMADRLIKQILILYAGNIGNQKDGKPSPKPLIEHYFKQVSDLLLRKDQGGNLNVSSSDTSGTGLISLPDFFKLDTLDVDTTMFTDDLYKKINSDIFMNLGVSEALIYGAGANYSSAQVNSEKFFRYIFAILEDFETVINGYINKLLPSNLQCKFYFDRTTMLDKDKHADKCKEFYTQTGILSPWAESLLGVPFHYALGLAQYEQQVLDISKIIKPPLNAHTMPGDGKGGRPEGGDGGDNTNKSKSSGGNNSPSPTD
jgi:hypothetical protein